MLGRLLARARRGFCVWGAAKQPHRRESLFQHSAPQEIKDFHEALLSLWPLNWGILKGGSSAGSASTDRSRSQMR